MSLVGDVTVACLAAAAAANATALRWVVEAPGVRRKAWRACGERVVDPFLAPRPWWEITHEPFADGEATEAAGDFRLGIVGDAAAAAFLRAAAALQFPPPAAELWWPRYVVKLNRARKFASLLGETTNGLLTAFSKGAAFVLVNDEWRLADGALCPRNKNFDCAFLPLTSVRARRPPSAGEFRFFSEGNGNLTRAASADLDGWLWSPKPRSSYALDRGALEAEDAPHGYTGHEVGPDLHQMWRPCADSAECRRLMGADCWVEAHLARLALRPRRRLRALLAARVAPETSAVDWRPPPRRGCATVHVRHGDVLLEAWAELRETYDLPVQRYLAAAAALTGRARPAIFLMTDDGDVVADARNYGADVRVLANATRGTHAKDLGVRGWSDLASSSSALVAILAETREASACGAFVGNCYSLFGRAIFRAMCAARGRCPPHHSLRPDLRCCGTAHRLQDERRVT